MKQLEKLLPQYSLKKVYIVYVLVHVNCGFVLLEDTSLVESSSQLSQLQESSHVQIQKLQDEVLNLKEQLEQHVCEICVLILEHFDNLFFFL